MLPRIRTPFRLFLLVLPLAALAPGCMLIASAPVVIPPPLPPATLAPGDRLLVRSCDALEADAPLMELVVAPDGTVALPELGPMPVDGYAPEDLAAVLLSVQPGLGAVRVEWVPARPMEASASVRPMEASASVRPAGR